jgi:phage-related protein
MMRKVVFEGDSLAMIRQFPDDARHLSGDEIDRVQCDLEPENWKPFPRIG